MAGEANGPYGKPLILVAASPEHIATLTATCSVAHWITAVGRWRRFS
jgi:hypothetical protein